MINVEAEINKCKSCKDRDELGRYIRDYKSQALQSAGDIVLAGQYNMVALRLQEIYDKMPAPRLKSIPTGSSQNVATKTATTSDKEKKKINAAWNKKIGKK